MTFLAIAERFSVTDEFVLNCARKLDPLLTLKMMATLQSMMARYGVISTTMILLQKEYAELHECGRSGGKSLIFFDCGKQSALRHTHID